MNFPLTARFKILAIAQQVAVEDASGTLLYYARQKAFKLKEAVTVFADEAQTRPVFTIAADRVLDISASYTITGPGGTRVGVLRREGMKSLWRTSYAIEAGSTASSPSKRSLHFWKGSSLSSGLARQIPRRSTCSLSAPS